MKTKLRLFATLQVRPICPTESFASEWRDDGERNPDRRLLRRTSACFSLEDTVW
jgi:hypothetical protein